MRSRRTLPMLSAAGWRMQANGGRHLMADLADASRRALLQALRSGAQSVTGLVASTGLKQPNVSNHLARLRESGVVVAQREGRQVFYSLADPMIETLLDLALGQARPDAGLCTDDLYRMAPRFAQAVLAGDECRARAILSECLARGVALGDLMVEVMQPAVLHLGALVEVGTLSIAEERLATELTERMLARAAQLYPSAPRLGLTAVVGSVAGNGHTLGVRMIADLLAHAGWDALFLGANVPTQDFVSLVAARRPHLVAVSCALAEHAEEAGALIRRVRAMREGEASNRLRTAVGGRYVNENPGFAEACGADLAASDARGALAAVRAAFA